MKKLLLLLCVLFAALGAFAYDFEANGIYYYVTSTSEKTVSVTFKDEGYNSYEGIVSIPATVEHNSETYSVTSIGGFAFYESSGLTSVTIPSSVISIGGAAFVNCGGLSSIIVEPDNPAFDSREDCNAIIETSSNRLIVGCQNTIIPSSVTSIEEFAFSACIGLASVTLPSTLTSIGKAAFRYCSSLTAIDLPNSVTSIGDWAFQECSGLTSITIPNSVTSIGGKVFYKCSNLTSVIIPNSVTSIGEWAFDECSSLTSITIPSSVTSIGKASFYGCSALGSVYCKALTPPDTGNGAFDGLPEDAILYVPAENIDAYRNAEGWSRFAEILPLRPCGDNLTWTLVDGTLTISGAGAMTNYESPEAAPWYDQRESITALVVRDGVTHIGNNAFANQTSLSTVSLPGSLSRIGQKVFRGDAALASVALPESLTSIEDWAFAECTSLSTIAIPASTTSVATTSIERCSSMQSISVAVENSVYTSVDGVLYDKAMTMIHTCPAGKSGAFVIPEGVTSIARSAFNGCAQLSSITIPEGVTSIGSWCFANCSSLTSIELPESMESIEYNAFRDCTSLVYIKSFSEMPSTLDVNVYDENGFFATPSRMILLVGTANIENYRNDEGWSQAFSSIIAYDASCVIATGQTFKMRLADNPGLYVAIDAEANDGGESGNSAVKFCSEEDASLLVFTQTGERVTITDARTGRGVCNSRAEYWRFANTDTDAWWVDYDELSSTFYLVGDYGYWKSDSEEVGSSLYNNGEKSLRWELVPYAVQDLDENAPYTQDEDVEVNELTYTRTFNNTKWQALYVPFQMSCVDWEDEFDVAQINNFHQYDRDNDDVFDMLEMEIIKVKNSTLKQNTPYLIRAKETGEHTIKLPDATLYAAVENSCVCMSMTTIYTFTGTYTGVSGEEMYNNGYYSMGGGALIQAASTASALKPYRWYLRMESRDGMVIPHPASVRVRVFGEDDIITGVEDVELGDNKGQRCFDLQGRVTNDKCKGLYIVNGKKILR